MSDIYVYKGKLWKPAFTFNYTGSPQKITLEPGEYLFICNGANGGLCTDAEVLHPATHGGTAYGILDLRRTTDFYAVVGGNGGDGSLLTVGSGGYNGGANGGEGYTGYSHGAGGGGATDIRLINPSEAEPVSIVINRYGVPDEYQPVEYLESSYTDNQWIDTQYIHMANTKIKCDMFTTSTGNHYDWETPFGARNNSMSYNAYYMFTTNIGRKQAVYSRTGAETTNDAYPYNEKVHVEAYLADMNIYDETGTTIRTTIHTTGTINGGVCSMTLFNLNIANSTKTVIYGNQTEFVGKIYNFVIYENDELKHYFVPVRRKSETYEFDLDITDIEQGTIGGSGDDSSSTRIRTKSFYRADCFKGTLTYEAYDINDNPLQLCISEYNIENKSSSYIITDGDWISAGSSYTFTSQYTSYIRFIFKYPSGSSLDPSKIKSCHITISDCHYGMFDVIDQTFHANKSITGNFTCGEDTEFEDIVETIETDTSTLSRIIVGGGAGGTAALNSGDQPHYFGIGGGVCGGAVVSATSDSNYGRIADQQSGYSFGVGMVPPNKVTSNTQGQYGAGGGGGGWYGGYAPSSDGVNSSGNGGGGSSYVVTQSSYKPETYTDYVSSDYYFTDPCMTGGTAENPSAIICRRKRTYSSGDKLIFPCIGASDEVMLNDGNYLIKCWGGDGGPRYEITSTPRGGYAEGKLHIEGDPVKAYVNVGGSGIRATYNYQTSLMCIPSLAFNGGGPAPELNDLRSSFGGGGTDVRLLENTLYHRLIVAGGAGGHGAGETANSSFGGAGGGLTGGNGSGSYGSVPGPGTQTSSPQGSDVGGDFGVGGTGSTRGGAGFGGAGGGGWYGGSGCYPDRYDDDDCGGAGGSGYLLTEESYKPTGYALDSTYYLTDTLFITGDSSLRYGQSKVEIIVDQVNNTRILCYDDEGTKSFNSVTGQWEFLSVGTPTISDFETYGSYTMNSDNGLLSNYTVYVYDTSGEIITTADLHICPPEQTVIGIQPNSNYISEVYVDSDVESSIESSVTCQRTTVDDVPCAELIIKVNMFDVPKTTPKFYSVSAYTQGRIGEYHDPTPKPKTLDHIDLLSVGIGNRMPARYKSYIGGFLPDGQEAITSIESSASCERNRVVYSAVLCNNKIVRFTKLNLLTNTSTIIRDISKTLLGNTYYGCLLVDDDYMYLSSIDLSNSIWKIPLDPSDLNIETLTIPTTPGEIDCCGKMYWYDEHTIVMASYRQSLWLYDTISNRWTAKKKDTSTSYSRRYDCALGQKYMITTLWGSSSSAWLIDVENNQWIDFAIAYYQFSESARRNICYGDGKFFFVGPSYIYIVDESNIIGHIEYGDPVSVTRITTSYGSSEPRTANYTNGLLYITFADSSMLYIYDVKRDTFTSTLLEFKQNNTSYSYNFYRPCTTEGYYFIGNIKLYVINYGEYAKYNMGYKFNQLQFILNIENENKFTYDPRFVSFRDSYMTIRDGTISKQVTDEGDSVYTVDINKSEYNKLLDISFTSEN
jgi:hypothetical protein